ncbi:ribosomal large subunit pseudouridylate synthase D [Spiroplasma gladiatoris]|uniref:Pseudouridine synthase n=1 Tax=Spiroplasma gladiatoris TaxID=2143 RepID=A0A4V1AQB6_9MOLU|nr:RluA family pseudouridine synthase [Spiroplasma gladiatoris]QBQ07929.1 ribosomal large subunit pseudouridylate synthase D [Spiroplasma gladiatoris]
MEIIYINENNSGERLDKYLVEFLKEEYDFSRSYVQSLIKEGYVKVNDKIVSSNYNLLDKDVINIDPKQPTQLDAKAQNIDFEIIFEDDDIIVLNKPNDLVVHPAVGNPDNTLVNGLLYKIKNLSSIGGVLRPGIVHRLDKKTTGIMIVAKTDKAHKALTHMLAENKIHKEYLAIVHGVIEPNKGTIDAPIGRDKRDRKKMCVTDINSKHAKTHFEVINRFENHTLIKCVIETGRTHQIRVHMAFIKHPVLGDHLYSFKEDKSLEFGQYLHSHKIKFNHPINNKEIELSCDLPKEFNDKIKEIEK